ncbi:hypothetical protein LEP1GSC192_1041 [Leptospira sp. B5-022]|nr:hypothetical protein LEP1GSC192_1041 [Leptospira sp. B5-022]
MLHKDSETDSYKFIKHYKFGLNPYSLRNRFYGKNYFEKELDHSR